MKWSYGIRYNNRKVPLRNGAYFVALESQSRMPQDPRPRKIGVVGVIARENKLLVIQRSQHVRSPGKFCFPGGAMEPGETEEQTLLRELREELGVNVTPRRLLQRTVTSWSVDLRWWQAELHTSEQITHDPGEVEAWHWMSVAEILAQRELLESNRHFLAAWHNAQFEIDGLIRSATH
jgi:mutator protein MutT